MLRRVSGRIGWDCNTKPQVAKEGVGKDGWNERHGLSCLEEGSGALLSPFSAGSAKRNLCTTSVTWGPPATSPC